MTLGSGSDIKKIFARLRSGLGISADERAVFETALMDALMEMDRLSGWVTQLHIGALRNCSTRIMECVGRDAGGDTMGDYLFAPSLRALLDCSTSGRGKSKIVLFNLNQRDNELLAGMMGCFAAESCSMQYGPAWWFADQRDGINRHFDALAAYGLLGRFIGMTTDSRSLLSFPRHEYFRRLLCDFIGRGVARGEIPGDLKLLGKLVKDVCYYNASSYFGFGG